MKASFDVTLLCANIPIKDTYNIILDQCFRNSTSAFNGFTRDLLLCLFMYNEELYVQKDVTPMGGVTSPTLANIFLCYHECFWLRDCPEK